MTQNPSDPKPQQLQLLAFTGGGWEPPPIAANPPTWKCRKCGGTRRYNDNECAMCAIERDRKYRSKPENREKAKKNKLEYLSKPENLERKRNTNREWHRKPENRENSRVLRRKREFGISTSDFESILTYQRGKCPVCNHALDTLLEAKLKIAIDHNHAVKMPNREGVRGVVHATCNKGVLADFELHGLAPHPEVAERLRAYIADNGNGWRALAAQVTAHPGTIPR